MKYNKKEIYTLGELMFDIVDACMQIHKFDLVFDYERFVNVVNPEKNKNLVELFNLVEHRRRWVYELVEEEKVFECKEK